MNRTDFYKRFAIENDVTQANAKDTCIAVFNLLARCIDENERVYIKGLGTFKKKMVKERRVGNFYGDEAVVIPACEKIVFEPFNGSLDDDE
jgi:nucleoid DNA-binding protein